MKRKVVSEGYTLKVNSWENDGDNSKTLYKTVKTLEEAKAYIDILNLCTSDGFGNNDRWFTADIELIREVIKKHPCIIKDEVDDGDEEIPLDRITNDEILDWFIDITYSVLDVSEHYACRVFESCEITYSPVDVYSEIIKF